MSFITHDEQGRPCLNIFIGFKPASAHEDLAFRRLVKETVDHHMNGTADTPEGQKAFAELRQMMDDRAE
jgi:hypothetical protein